MTRIYYTASDNGDGSCSVEFYESRECIDLLEEEDPEYYRGEGGGWFDVDGTITGINIKTMEEVREQLDY